MPKKKRILRQRCHAPPHDTAAEIQERRRLELSAADAAKDDNKTWVSESWNEGMDSLLQPQATSQLEEADGVDGVSMDLGYDDENDDHSDSELTNASSIIVCDRSYARGDPREAQWDSLTQILWANTMVAGITSWDGLQRSIEMEHPSHAPSSTTTPKIGLFNEAHDSVDMKDSVGSDVEVQVVKLKFGIYRKLLAPLDPAEIDADSDCWFQIRKVVVIVVVSRSGIARGLLGWKMQLEA
ncbi:hypothetical protein C8R43DRAFT_959570 [Mycena crocata]|nr:hypothetical protein C8R43DRAFT_959570 [Mycena crocata]